MPTNVSLVKGMVFPAVMYGCESWTIKKAERWRIDAFESWCWRRLLRVLWTTRRSNLTKENQSWIFIGRTDAEAEAPILWPPDVMNWLLGKDPDAGKDWRQEEKGEDRGWDGWMASSTWQTWVWASSGSWWWTGKPGVLQSIGSQRVRHDWVTELIAKNWRAAHDNIFVNHNIFILILTPFPLSYKLKIKFIWVIIFIVFKRRLWDSKPRYRFYFNIRITSLTI